MNGQDVKETMEQIHISEKMQEEIIMKIQNRMENGKKRVWNLRKMGTVAAAFALAVGIISVPVHAMVSNLVKARMESIPVEEVQEIENMIQTQDTNADGFSREYSDTEKARSKVLWQAYENGTFPENEIQCVDSADAVTKGTLCYVNATGDFYLPDGEMTDEEILEIIDFQHKMSYSIEQGSAAQEARAERAAEESQLKEKVQAVGGISEEEAIEIARKQMKAELGARADQKELLLDWIGRGASIEDISEETSYEHKGDVAYVVGFGNPDDYSTYTCWIDAVDGRVLYSGEYIPGEN